jgi:hypothetical protein
MKNAEVFIIEQGGIKGIKLKNLKYQVFLRNEEVFTVFCINNSFV